MSVIFRDPIRAGMISYDLIIIGGGIYGAMLALESACRGLRPLLLEKHDFGAATSFNSLRILHGGFRYLQSLNLSRFMTSVNERSWFLRTFPELTYPKPFLMPLYGQGLRKPAILKIALAMNHLLSLYRNNGLQPDKHLPSGQVVGIEETKEIFPEVNTQGLLGGAVWFDVYMPDSQRVLMETLRWSCKEGATILNYVQAMDLLCSSSQVEGIVAKDMETGAEIEFRSRVVINTTGPWCRLFARKCHKDIPSLFKPSLAWNILLNRSPLSDHGLAVTPSKPGGRTYFLLPWKGMVLAGTGHSYWDQSPEAPSPSKNQLIEFINDLNMSIPTLEVSLKDIRRVFSGLLPTVQEGGSKLLDSPVILDHGRLRGPQGLFSISGVKFTTARDVAERTIKRIVRSTTMANHKNQKRNSCQPRIYALPEPDASMETWISVLKYLINDEAVLHLNDLFLHRTNLWHDIDKTMKLADAIVDFFPWNSNRREYEMNLLYSRLVKKYS